MAKFRIEHELVGHFRRGDVISLEQLGLMGDTQPVIDRLVNLGAVSTMPDDTPLFLSADTIAPAPVQPVVFESPAPKADDKDDKKGNDAPLKGKV